VVSRISSMNDWLVMCTAESELLVLVVNDSVETEMDENGYHLLGIEGVQVGSWILMDYDDVVVHVFKTGVREAYGLDRLWSDAKRVLLSRAQSAESAAPTRPRVTKEHSLKQRG